MCVCVCARVEAGSDCLSSSACVSLVEAGGAHWLVHLLTVIGAGSSKISTASNLTLTLFRGGSYSETLEQCGKVMLPCTLNLDLVLCQLIKSWLNISRGQQYVSYASTLPNPKKKKNRSLSVCPHGKQHVSISRFDLRFVLSNGQPSLGLLGY